MVTVAPLGYEDIPAARALLTGAIDDDPGWVRVLPDRSRSVALSTVLGVALRDAQPNGFVLAAHDGDTLAGVALWRPPGSYPMSRRRQLRAAPSMTRLALRIGMRDMRALARFGTSLVQAFPTDPVWYLEVLGVHPAMLRRGIGTALLRPVLQMSDGDGVSCYLETGKPGNVAYYERLGFGLVAPASPLYEGGPTMWRMLRPPQSTANDPALES